MAKSLTRRNFLKAGALGTLGIAASTAALAQAQSDPPTPEHTGHTGIHGGHGSYDGSVGEVDTSNFDPMTYLTDFDYGRVSTLPNGQTLREWDVYAVDQEIEVAPGVYFPAWAYGAQGKPPQVPGPTFRCTEGDRLRFNFGNGSSHPHTIHFHGIHPPSMDGITPIVKPGETFTYEFDAKPFGLHLYHCHVMPLKRHIHKGLYGTFIIDPKEGREPAKEFVMMMNAFDTNFDGENEIYAVNTVAFHYAKHPIPVKVGELIRVYLVNITEFDPVNSFHLHAGMYKLFRTGTRMGDHYEYTDNVLMGQGERHVLEFVLEHPGHHMFHSHQSELAELGWMGMFDAQKA
jgi:FtsP/CotA-like multicopper oxidase with cupredoxin domain